MKAIWNGRTIAESAETVIVEENHYFPPESVDRALLRESARRTTCPWKGEAHYYDIIVDGKENRGAAWTYPSPKDAASHIKDHIAFWKGVEVID